MANRHGLAIVAAIAILAGCSEARSSAWDSEGDDRDLFGLSSQFDPQGEVGGWTYAAFDEERDRSSAGDFMGFGCLDSCDGHEAGYAWAGEHGMPHPMECGGNSWSFIEGCVAWAVENYEPPEDDERPERGLY